MVLVFAALGGGLYSPALLSWFASDDFLHYARLIKGGVPFWPGPEGGGFLRPLVGLSFLLDYQLWGLHPLPAHAINVIIHIANSLLVVVLTHILQRNRPDSTAFPPLAAGLLFLMLGSHAEPVAWIACRGDLMATCFVLLMLIGLIRGLESGEWFPCIASVCCLLLALLSKESAFAAPMLALLVLCWLYRQGRIARGVSRAWTLLALHAVALTGYLLLRRELLGGFVAGYGPHGHLRTHPDLVAQAQGHHLWRVFFPPLPDGLLALLPPLQGVLALAFLAGLLSLIGWAAWRVWRKSALIPFCVLAFAVALFPVFNVPIYLSEIEGERYLYLPSVFATIGLAMALATLRGTFARATLCAVLLVGQASILLTGVFYWHRATMIARTVVGEIQEQHTGGEILLLNKPDTYRGALVFRTGLPEALRYFGPKPLPGAKVEALFATGLYQRHPRFDFGPAKEGPTGTFSLRALDDTSEIIEEDRFDRIEVKRKQPNQADFVFRRPLQAIEIFYYDGAAIKIFNVSEWIPSESDTLQ